MKYWAGGCGCETSNNAILCGCGFKKSDGLATKMQDFGSTPCTKYRYLVPVHVQVCIQYAYRYRTGMSEFEYETLYSTVPVLDLLDLGIPEYL